MPVHPRTLWCGPATNSPVKGLPGAISASRFVKSSEEVIYAPLGCVYRLPSQDQQGLTASMQRSRLLPVRVLSLWPPHQSKPFPVKGAFLSARYDEFLRRCHASRSAGGSVAGAAPDSRGCQNRIMWALDKASHTPGMSRAMASLDTGRYFHRPRPLGLRWYAQPEERGGPRRW
jgi:hypothetical protein